MKNEITLSPVHLNQLPALAAVATEDKHVLIHPTHIVSRGTDIVGYASLGTVRMMFAWLDTNRLKAPESFRAWRMARTEMERLHPGEPVCLPCTFDSPLLPFVERMGYKGIFNARIHLKPA